MTLIEKELILFKDTFFLLIVHQPSPIACYAVRSRNYMLFVMYSGRSVVNKNRYLAPAFLYFCHFDYCGLLSFLNYRA